MSINKLSSLSLQRIELLFRPPMEQPNHVPVRRLFPQTSNQPTPLVLPIPDGNPMNLHNDAPPKYSPPPSYGRAVGARVAKVLRNSIRRSVRRFRRNNDSDGPSQQRNVPSISSIVHDSAIVNSVNDFIRSRIQRQNDATNSVENLLMSDMSLNIDYNNQREPNRSSVARIP